MCNPLSASSLALVRALSLAALACTRVRAGGRMGVRASFYTGRG